MTETRSGIAADCVQEVLESASNAGDKGQSQFETPIELAKILRGMLPRFIEVVTDLCAGHGNFASGIADSTTTNLLLCEIQRMQNVKTPWRAAYQSLDVSRVTADITKFYPLLKSVKWEGDCFVGNPPFDHHWYKENLAQLAHSEFSEIRNAFAVDDPRVGRNKIDSTIASILMMLDMMSAHGEGLLIANGSTMERLIFSSNAPYRMLRPFFWVSLEMNGNPMTGDDGSAYQDGFKTRILGFAKSHPSGPQMVVDNINTLSELAEKIKVIADIRQRLRHGLSIRYANSGCKNSVSTWDACRGEWSAGQKSVRTDYNIWLEAGVIKCQLSRYDAALEQVLVNKRDANALFRLNGSNPMSLVLQSESRAALVRAVKGDIWRVHPDLTAEVDKCIAEYSAVRAPLYPLSDTQRLGFLDEEKFIRCKKDFFHSGKTIFAAGQTYTLATKTVEVERETQKPNMAGEMERILNSGHELLIEITGEDGKPHPFLEQKHLRPGVTVTLSGGYQPLAVDFTLQQLLEHFDIPHVPDVSETSADCFNANKAIIRKIQAFIKEFIDANFLLKKFQIEDIARAGCHDGLVLSWDTGLGKSIAAILYPLVKVGVNWTESRHARGFVPLKPVLIVAPENLHDQLDEEWQRRYGIKCRRLYTQDDYLKLPKINGRDRITPGFWLSSYTQMGMNGVKPPPDPQKCPPEFSEIAKVMFYYGVDLEEAKNYKGESIPETPRPGYSTLMERALSACEDKYEHFTKGIGEEGESGIKCICSPSLADLCGHEWGAVIIDEGTRIKGEDTIIGRAIRELDPKVRLVLTATPVKNRLRDLFWLIHWAAGGKSEPHARMPYSDESDQQDKFAAEFLVCERNLTKEAKESLARGNVPKRRRKKPRGKPGVEVCNIHRLWKLIAPIILRRRKIDIGEDIVRMNRSVIRAPLGSEQYRVYKYHLEAPYVDKNGMPAIMAKLQALRSVAAAPNSELLRDIEGAPTNEPFRSDKDYTPKMAAALTIIEQRMRLKEQTVVFSDLHEPLDTLSRRLTEAGVPHDVLDGRKSPTARGKAAKAFKAGLKKGAKPVLLAGARAMGEGNSWNLCRNCVLVAYAWALDVLLQSIARIYRLDSPEDVNVWAIICQGSIDRKLESMTTEKNDSSELVLDGKLSEDIPQEVNLAELLEIAIRDFRDAEQLSEAKLERDWPELKSRLADAWEQCQNGKVVAPAKIITPSEEIVLPPIPIRPPVSELLKRVKALQMSLI